MRLEDADLMKIGEVAHLFGVEPKTVKRWAIDASSAR